MTILIPFAGLSPTPWKNGGGITTEIAIGPPGAGLQHFAWRISLATISHNGPFSRFAGVDRTLALIDGPGFTLDIDGERHLLLDIDDGTIAFAGEATVTATIDGAPTTDFNVMTRRDVCVLSSAAAASTAARRFRRAASAACCSWPPARASP